MSATTSDLPIPQTATGRLEEIERQSQATVYRDVNDVRLLKDISVAVLLQSLLLVISFGVIIYLATRPPRQVIIERTGDGDRVVAINGQAVRNGIILAADRPGAGDKKTLAREWAAARYGIDPITREKDLEKMFRMMEPNAAKAYSNVMKKNGELERESAERWRTVWKLQVIEVDRNDPYRVNVVGALDITKKAPSGERQETKQLMFSLHLLPDTDKGRAPRNAQTGFLVDDILDYKELPVGNSSTSALKAEAQ
ncbi:MAG: hypothetical protein MOB07_14010 [Acidobacteria bacterium]|nr:hypothetical protein [Acidobacteriota bacterium]